MPGHPGGVAGVGIGLRREHFRALLATTRRVDWLELTPENFVRTGGEPRRVLDALRERWPLVPHSVSLSLGGPDPLHRDLLDALGAFYAEIRAPFCSDHLAWASVGGVFLHDLLPLPFSEEAVAHVVPRLREAALALDRPLAIENPTYYARLPGSTLDEAAFLRAVLEEASCGLLLDVNNLHVNACNHGYDPLAFLDALPLERVVELHLAGHRRAGGRLLDDHSAPVSEPVWALYREVVRRTGPVPTLVEWDNDVPPLDALLDEADRARAILDEVASACAGAGAQPGGAT